MKTLKYNDTEFRVKENTLGVGKTIAELAAKYEDELAIAKYHIIKLPDYDRYQILINNAGVIAQDVAEQKQKASKLKGTAKKKQEAIVTKGQKDFQSEVTKLKEPILTLIANRVANIEREVYFGFTNDTDIFKTLCDTLLIGDTSQIKFNEPDKDLLELRDEVYAAFFTIKSSIYK